MVRDKHGKKMSKTNGNVIDPLHIVNGVKPGELAIDARKHYESLFEEYPEGIEPQGADALRFGEQDPVVTDQLTRFSTPGNLLGVPALSVPAGYDANGLPIGVQLIAGPWEEGRLLRVARAVERVVTRRSPATQYTLLTGEGPSA